jgi:mannose-1-phosphate guanylyltransferase/mannose-6-phosphate isomerase
LDQKPQTNSKIIPVVLCGGSGTRLWPLSRERAPKQFHNMMGKNSLLNQTLERAVECSAASAKEIITVTTELIKRETIHQLADFDPDTITHMISEPHGNNTATAIAFATLYAHKHFSPNSVLWILPSDHYIKDNKTVAEMLENALPIVEKGYIVTFGISPTRPETGYGYIKTGANLSNEFDIMEVDKFVEKPNEETAANYLKEGNYLWNSGIFLANIETILENYADLAPQIISALKTEMGVKNPDIKKAYQELPALPFDTIIMEKTKKAAVIPCDIGWSDVGSWEGIWNINDKDKDGNVKNGRVAAVNSKNCLIQSNNLLVAAMGLEDIIIIENGDSILVADKNNADGMKSLVHTLKKMDCPETITPPMENRPWGKFRILSERPDYKVKEITVHPNCQLSLQMHNSRCEFWTVISGEATVSINHNEKKLKAQESAFIPLKTLHRLKNSGTENLVVIEVQCGDYLGEDDIIRFDDQYGRTIVA